MVEQKVDNLDVLKSNPLFATVHNRRKGLAVDIRIVSHVLGQEMEQISVEIRSSVLDTDAVLMCRLSPRIKEHLD